MIQGPVQRSNLVLVGMPGSGKSTVGVLLAKQAALDFVDTDLLIQSAEGRSLQAIVDEDGYAALRQVEERVLLATDFHHHVIATGGSAVYSDAAMHHLKCHGLVIFLDVSLATVERRIGNFSLRGISKRGDQSIAELFQERYRLYRSYADLIIDADGLDQDQVCGRILATTGLA